MIDRGQLIEHLAPNIPWQKANEFVEQCIRQHFTEYPELTLDSRELVEAFLPLLREGGMGPGMAARERLKRVLRNLKKYGHLQGYWTEASEVKTLYGNTFHPTHWHAYREGSSNVVPAKRAQSKPLADSRFLVLEAGTLFVRPEKIIAIVDIEGEGDYFSTIHLTSGESIDTWEKAADILALIAGQALPYRDANGHFYKPSDAETGEIIDPSAI